MRRLLLFTLTVVIVLAGCSDNSKLTREKAKAIIEEKVNRVISAEIPKSANVLPWDRDIISGTALISLMSRFTDEGLITCRNTGMLAWWFSDIQLTEKGKQFVVGQSASGNPMVKLCETESYEVTGIEQPTEKSAIVHYTTQIKNITPFGLAAPKICASQNNPYIGKMTLFDEGWRLISAKSE